MNILAILGVTSTVRPFAFERKGIVLDLGVMMAFFFLSWLMLFHQRRVGRFKGATLVFFYVLYILHLYR
jgi:Ca2+/Na+ antiporter